MNNKSVHRAEQKKIIHKPNANKQPAENSENGEMHSIWKLWKGSNQVKLKNLFQVIDQL